MMAVASLVTASSDVAGRSCDSRGSGDVDKNPESVECQIGESSPAVSPRPSEPEEDPRSFVAGEDIQQAWALRQVRNIQAEIQALKGDVTERTHTVAAIDEDLRNLEEEYNIYDRTTGQVILRGLREIKKDYNGKLEILKSKLMKLAASKLNDLEEEYSRKVSDHNRLKVDYDQKVNMMTSKLLAISESRRNEIDRLNSDALEISRKAKGLECYQGIIDYLNNEARGVQLS